MKLLKIAAVLAMVALAATVALQRAVMAQAASNLRILSPQNGARIATDFVEVRYQLLNPGAAASSTPTYQLQLDGSDPIRTVATSHTFTGLKPGSHTVLVELVDANSMPVAGSINAVQFTVLPPPAAPSPKAKHNSPGNQPQVAAPHSPEPPPPEPQPPNSGSALPLLSVIGFGVLLGGTASALKTR